MHLRLTGLVVLLLAVASCTPSTVPTGSAQDARILLVVEGTSRTLQVPTGTTVRDVLTESGVRLGPLDRVTPSENTFVDDGAEIRVVRVSESFELVEIVVPFERQTIVNYGLPEGETRLQQGGQNGLQADTYRIVIEDEVEVSRSLVQSELVQPPVAEIVMVGGQASFVAIPIPGTLAFVSSGNAWIARETSNDRRPVTVSSDLDGRVFSLSPDGKWLLYSRQSDPSEQAEAFNSLWLVSTLQADAKPIDARTSNVLFAEWSPAGDGRFAYATGRPSDVPPGYVADNNLIVARIDARGRVTSHTRVRETSCGGQSAWWGTTYAWRPDGQSLAYAQADRAGRIDLASKECTPLLQFAAYNTYENWAWVPAVAWAPDGSVLYTIEHGLPLGLESAGDSQAFHLVALTANGSNQFELVSLAGMFAGPVPSPALPRRAGERPHLIAYLHALDPQAGAKSAYRLTIIDRDGSNAQAIFPDAGLPGLLPQTVSWSPDGRQIALIYQGNLWIVDVESGRSQQLTADSATMEPQWAA